RARPLLGDDRIDALAPLDVTDVDDAGHVVVTLEGPLGPIGVRLRETFSEPIFTMCQARSTGPVTQWELVSTSALERRGRRGGRAEQSPGAGSGVLDHGLGEVVSHGLGSGVVERDSAGERLTAGPVVGPVTGGGDELR